jgi:hypothetical protein
MSMMETDVTDSAHKNNADQMTFPSHCSHILQLPDLSFYHRMCGLMNLTDLSEQTWPILQPDWISVAYLPQLIMLLQSCQHKWIP